jgi:hypothetical protein
MSEGPEVWEVLRCDRLSGVLAPSYHAKIQAHEDGSQTEHRISLPTKSESSHFSQVA